MTKKEFTKYLKSIGGLEDGFKKVPSKYYHPVRYRLFKIFQIFYSDKKNPFRNKINDAGFFDVSDGWLELLKACINECIANGWNREICQVKEKFGCYDDKTEVLTKQGWKYFRDCKNDTEFACLNDDGFLEYHKATDIIKYHYDGEMYYLKTRGVDLMVTPNHNLYVAKGNSHGNFEGGSTKKHSFELITPKKYFGKSKRFLKSLKWKGEVIDKLTIPGYSYSNFMKLWVKKRTYHKENQVYNIKNFLKFLGFYTAEGSCNPNSGEISIACCNDDSLKAKIEQDNFEKILIENNLPIKKENETKSAVVYRIYNKVLARWLSINVGLGAKNKQVPDFIKNLTPNLIRVYLKWLYFGDAHKSKTAETLYTVSKKLSEDVQELLLKIGNTFSVIVRPPRINLFNGKLDCYCINWLKKSNDFNIELKILRNLKNKEEWVHYNGMVYCATVPYNKLFVKRNGKGVWCGNSLRFYINDAPKEVHDIISKYENLSSDVCEYCGREGQLRKRGWWKTLCDNCYRK